MGYQRKLHKVCILVAGAQLNFCLAKKTILMHQSFAMILAIISEKQLN